MTYPQQKSSGGNRQLEDYIPVHTRVEKFRAEHPAGRILTSIVSRDPLTFRAEVYFDATDVPCATGHADEEGGMGLRAKSAMEKTETAAVGRALAFAGYEIKEGLASREEMEKAVSATQPAKAPLRAVDSPENDVDVQIVSVYAQLSENREVERQNDPTLKSLPPLPAAVNRRLRVRNGLSDLSAEQKLTLLADLQKTKAEHDLLASTKMPDLPANPKTAAETLTGHIVGQLTTLGWTDEELNEWARKQFALGDSWKGDWSDLSEHQQRLIYANFQGKIEAAEAAK